MTLSRKAFLSAAAAVPAIAAAGTALPTEAQERASMHFALLEPGQFDAAAMLRTLRTASAHRQVFQSVEPRIVAPAIASLYMHMQNSMNAYEFSLDLGHLSTLAVLLGGSIVFGLNDAIWQKYAFATALDAKDLAPTNAYYRANSRLELGVEPDDPSGIYQDWSAQAVVARGGAFFVCHNATSGIAALCARKRGADPKAVLAEFERGLLPGFQMVPAGVAAIQQAQENGWRPFPVI